MALEPEDRTEEVVGGDVDSGKAGKTPFEPHPDSIAGRKAQRTGGECRMVVEVFFDIPKKSLRELSDRYGQNFIHNTDYLRFLKEQLDSGDIDFGHLTNNDFATGQIRYEAAK